ncbi:MAG: hypothetical protein KME23_13270 [Goleter apudmare HA4340-LM2]|jgi:hypothetical protein|nr:hypothetical protein [Goleter apudmare HA4340-LM2]
MQSQPKKLYRKMHCFENVCKVKEDIILSAEMARGKVTITSQYDVKSVGAMPLQASLGFQNLHQA